jgi:hypothetical protein
MAVKVYCEDQKIRRAEIIRNFFFCGQIQLLLKKEMGSSENGFTY